MRLTRDEQEILRGKRGEGMKKAMELLAALGEINGAKKLIPVRSAQISGVSYATIGEAGMEFLEDWASLGAKAQIFATLNPAGIDIERWEELGFPREFAEKQMRIVKAYEAMGIIPTCTCTPYLVGNLPRFGEHIAWAESSAVVFANSVLGARTNRESAVSALASALVGKTPYHGLHLDKNRRANFTVHVKAELKSDADYSALGYFIAKNYNGIPLFKGINPGARELKALSAALGTGAINMFMIPGITPECHAASGKKIVFSRKDLKHAYETLSGDGEVDAICIGCPHASAEEIIEAAKLNTDKKILLFTSRQNRALVEKYVKNLNIKTIYDTCMVVAPLKEMGIKSVGVNSAKAAFYCASLSQLKVRFDSLENLVK